MGASNVLAAYARWAGKVPPLAMQCLAYMAVVSKDSDSNPWFSQGHEALAEHALGRAAPITASDVRAVGRVMTELLKAKAVTVDRRAAVRRSGASTARYRLNLGPFETPENTTDARRKSSYVNDESAPEASITRPVDNSCGDPPRRTVSGPDAGRFVVARRTVSGHHAGRKPSYRGDREEPEERENQEEEVVVRTDLEVARATPAKHEPDLPAAATQPAEPPPATGAPRPLVPIPPPAPGPAAPGRCPHHPAMPAGEDRRGRPHCVICRTQGRPLHAVPGGVA